MSKPSKPNMYAMYAARVELFNATPMSVWREYDANGYLWVEMVNEELSYAETE